MGSWPPSGYHPGELGAAVCDALIERQKINGAEATDTLEDWRQPLVNWFRSFSWLLRPFILGSMNAINCPNKTNVEDLIVWQSLRHHCLYSQILVEKLDDAAHQFKKYWITLVWPNHGSNCWTWGTHSLAYAPVAAGGRCGLWLSWTGWGTSPRPQSQALSGL